jgi:hypothetical protein
VLVVGKVQALLPVCTLPVSTGVNSVVVAAGGGGAVIMVVVAEVMAR